MSIAVYVLTALAALQVVLTRLRLNNEARGAGHFQVPQGIALGHTVTGTLALLAWVPFLVFPEDSLLGGALMGIIGLGFFWITTILGLLILMRWLPSRGKHADDLDRDNWGGPGLSLLAHLGMLLGVCFFTYAYLTSAV